ncbi:MAG: transcription elongation factor GreA, partial [Bacilli bacterium]|nr:transcription elongation factor GreA [Bacilli bacterium]
MANEKIELTKEGYQKLLEEYENLVNVERPRILADLAAARAQGDLSENADYDSAKKQQAEIEEKIARIEYIKQNHIIIDDNGKKA